jgi:hypothetical protein
MSVHVWGGRRQRVQVLQDDGSMLAVALNAVCAALADAGIPMRCLFGERPAREGGGGLCAAHCLQA